MVQREGVVGFTGSERGCGRVQWFREGVVGCSGSERGCGRVQWFRQRVW